MTEMIPYKDESTAVGPTCKTVLAATNASDKPSLFQSLLNAVRQIVGFKPLSLSVRFAESQVVREETRNTAEMLKAREEFELTQAKVRRMDLEAAANAEETKAEAAKTKAEAAKIKAEAAKIKAEAAKIRAEAAKINAEAAKTEAEARIEEVAARQIEQRKLSRSELRKQARLLIKRIEDAGGQVETPRMSGDASSEAGDFHKETRAYELNQILTGTIVMQSIQDSFNTLQGSTANKELKSKLEELTKEIAEQCRFLPDSVARQLTEDVSSLVKESLKQSPRREWYEPSAKGIVQAASALGAASEKIVGLVKGVLSLLTTN